MPMMRINRRWMKMRIQVRVIFGLCTWIFLAHLVSFPLTNPFISFCHFTEGLIHKPALRKSTLIQTMKVPTVESPPYRKVRALRLYDTPATPKTLFKKATIETPAQNRFIRKTMPSVFPPQTPNNRPMAYPVNRSLEPMSANINPFSPSSMCTDHFSYSWPFDKLSITDICNTLCVSQVS